ncbi:MAG: glycosyltransferase family 2 protein [Deltaproteobacteria bacterium]|nr:glycosyltransferase family 2 protein [Deltaproteobacteria bacterium]MBM4318317.1 glycosyltransferase family 2 protein [Deltaproteobacteria bacterium]
MLEFQLVLPCYNESKSLKYLIERAVNAAKEAGYDFNRFQLVLVENGSLDNSKEVLSELEKTSWAPWFTKVLVSKNQGYGYGVMQGLKSTKAPIIGWSHADQQCDPKDAFMALMKLKTSRESHVLVKGVRSGRNWKDRWVTHIFEMFALLILGVKTKELNAQPKIFPRTLLDHLGDPPFNFAFDLYVLYCALKSGFQVKTIPVLFPPRVHGVSNWASTFFGRYKTILGMIQYMCHLSKTQGRI